jgi:hypothetical protein
MNEMMVHNELELYQRDALGRSGKNDELLQGKANRVIQW